MAEFQQYQLPYRAERYARMFASLGLSDSSGTEREHCICISVKTIVVLSFAFIAHSLVGEIKI